MVWEEPKTELLLPGALWSVIMKNNYFVMQQRRGKGGGILGGLIGTMDSLLEANPSPFRILLQTPQSGTYLRACVRPCVRACVRACA